MIRSLAFALVAACSSTPAPKQPTTPPGGADASGTLSGSVYKVGVPCPDPTANSSCDGPAANMELVVYKEDGTTEAGKTTTTAEGTFTIDLPPGKYVILGPRGIGGEQSRTEVEVHRDALSKVEVRFDSGVRTP